MAGGGFSRPLRTCINIWQHHRQLVLLGQGTEGPERPLGRGIYPPDRLLGGPPSFGRPCVRMDRGRLPLQALLHLKVVHGHRGEEGKQSGRRTFASEGRLGRALRVLRPSCPVASDSGETALKLWEALRGSGVKIVSVAGYAGGDEPSIGPERIRELDRRFGR